MTVFIATDNNFLQIADRKTLCVGKELQDFLNIFLVWGNQNSVLFYRI